MNITSDKEAFEYVRQHLLTQNEKSVDEDASCMYRGILKSDLDSIAYLENVEDEDYWNNEGIELYHEALADLPKDAMCAVGALIADDVYDPDIENSSIKDNDWIIQMVKESNPNWNIDDDSIQMLEVLQTVHDRKNTNEWETILKMLEINFNEQNKWTGELI